MISVTLKFGWFLSKLFWQTHLICWKQMKLPSHHLFILLKSAIKYILVVCNSCGSHQVRSCPWGENFNYDNFSFIYKPCLHNLKNNVYFFSPFYSKLILCLKCLFRLHMEHDMKNQKINFLNWEEWVLEKGFATSQTFFF